MPSLAGFGLTLILEAAFTATQPPPVTVTTFLLNDGGQGLLDTDQLGGANAWTDITPYMRSVSVSRPWSRQQGPVWQAQAATITAVLRNGDGRFDPDNLSGPYAAAGVSAVRPMVPVRLRAIWRGVEYQLFNGFATGWQDAGLNIANYAECTMTAQDAFYVLAGVMLATAGAAGANELSGARINRILNAAGWYGSGDKRNVQAGQSQMQATTLGDFALNLLQLTTLSELGELYVSGPGAVTFRQRQALLADARSVSPQLVLGDIPGTVHPAGTEVPYASATRADDDTTMANDIQVTRAGGTLQEAQSASSVAEFLVPRSYPASPILTTDAEALQQAQWLLYVAQDDENRFDQVTIMPLRDPGNLGVQALSREAGDRVQVWRRPPGFPVVTLYGAPGTLPVLGPESGAMLVTPTGHTFTATPVPGWRFGAGEALFYTLALPNGQIVLTTTPLTENELSPTADHAEVAIFDPVALTFRRIIIPTSTGAVTALKPGTAFGGTDAGGGDIVLAGSPLAAIFTCTGYYFGWDLQVTGLYPAVGFLTDPAGVWQYSAAASNFLTGNDTGFEGGTGHWVANTNCSISSVTAQAHSGTHSLQMSSTAAGDMIAASFNSSAILTTAMPVTPGQQVLSAAWVRTAASTRTCFAGATFYDNTGTQIGSATFGATGNTDLAAAWSQVSAVLTAPANAAFCRALVKVQATGGAAEIHYADDVTLELLGQTSLSGDQLELTNPAAFAAFNPAPTSGLNGTYWNTRGISQMAVFPQSGNVACGHYFNGNGFNSGCLSVISTSGALLASYQIPSMNRQDAVTSILANPREIKADPSSALNDERFFVVYDCFGNGNAAPSPAHVIQEFTYNASAQTITPKSVPCISADDDWSPSFCICDSSGTLYVAGGSITGGSGLLARSIAVYAKSGGERALVTQAPATGSWATNGSYATPVAPDFTVSAPQVQGIGTYGPMAIDSQTGAVMFPGLGGQLGAVVPASPLTASANMLADSDASFEPPGVLTNQDSYLPQAGTGSWAVFLASCTISQGAPPVAPPSPAVNGLKEVATGTGQADAHTGFYPLTAGHVYGISASFLAHTGMTGVQCDLWINWFDASFTSLGNSATTSVTDATATWTTTTTDFNVTAPASTAYGQLWFRVNSTAVGQAHWITDAFIWDLTAGWTGFVTTVRRTDKQAHAGSFSLALIAPFSQSQVIAQGPVMAVQPLTEYQASAWFRTDTGVATGTCSLTFNWFGSTGAQIGAATTATKTAATSTSGWTRAYSSGLAPASAVTGQLVATVSGASMTAGQIQFVDDAVMQENPFTAPPACDTSVTALRALGYAVSLAGRPCIAGRTLYIPWASVFTAAENAAYGSSYVPDTAHPQYLAAVSIDQFLAGGYGAITKDCFIRSITHDFSPDAAPYWQTAWQLQSAARYGNFLILGQSPQGRLGTGALAY